MKEPVYYRIKRSQIIGRQDDMFRCFIYVPGQGWQPDHNNILMDRLIGYSEIDHEIGNTDVLFSVDEISEEEALEAIHNLEGQI